ncbi:MAG: cytochrome c554 family protein [Desulfobacteraceae bacterium]|nr:MAG: cytochrome c554 family protein [Desulfobacteraceae bacterium]
MRCRNRYPYFFMILIGLLMVPARLPADPFQISQFISPETCGECHSEIFHQWKGSMHSLSQKDPIYLSVSEYIRKGLIDRNEIAEAESCVKCHVPVGVVTGYPQKTSDDRKNIPEIANHGIQCDYCHSATHADKMYNNGLVLSPGNGEEDPGVKRGPFPDSESDFHESAFSEFHTGSEICGTCHNVKHVVYMTDLETTYEEWKRGPYNHKDPDKRITCQGCHMFQRPGIPATGSTERPKNKGVAADDGPVRDHIFTHYFVGGNGFVPGLFSDQTKSKMADDRLRNAATLSIETGKVKDGKLEIVITNTGAGHDLPTGLTDIRQMWLDIEIWDKHQKKQLYVSGKPDKDHYLPEGTIIYNTVFGDGKGNPVWNIAKAKEILSDKRIPPQQSVTETIPLPPGKWTELSVQVKLLYRSAPQKIVDQAAGKGKLILPIVTMASADQVIKRQQQ